MKDRYGRFPSKRNVRQTVRETKKNWAWETTGHRADERYSVHGAFEVDQDVITVKRAKEALLKAIAKRASDSAVSREYKLEMETTVLGVWTSNVQRHLTVGWYSSWKLRRTQDGPEVQDTSDLVHNSLPLHDQQLRRIWTCSLLIFGTVVVARYP